ncbi:hypothetical protein CC80DRAFT_494843 [Byssothecium circinans]|uniref:Uncharacterized protein n=1 Tax=Byssothecium circinans TaxID=147558 RepID=A0A6A5TNF0_9PLEO|nr:hypothetical protein CC80DRAFT_494843 [Byssothecium circinans]
MSTLYRRAQLESPKVHIAPIFYVLYVFLLLLMLFFGIKRIIGPCPRFTIAHYIPNKVFTSWQPFRKRVERHAVRQEEMRREEERQMQERVWTMGERRYGRVFGTVEGRVGGR